MIYFVVLVAAVLFFIVAREFVCWYWKLNAIADTLERIAVDIAAIRSNSARGGE